MQFDLMNKYNQIDRIIVDENLDRMIDMRKQESKQKRKNLGK